MCIRDSLFPQDVCSAVFRFLVVFLLSTLGLITCPVFLVFRLDGLDCVEVTVCFFPPVAAIFLTILSALGFITCPVFLFFRLDGLEYAEVTVCFFPPVAAIFLTILSIFDFFGGSFGEGFGNGV